MRLDPSGGGLIAAQQYLFYVSPGANGSVHRVAKNGKKDETLLPNLGDGLRLELGASGVFVGQGMAGKVVLLPSDGSGNKTIASGEIGLVDLAVNGAQLFLARSNGIRVMAQTGGPSTPIATAKNPTAIAADDDYVFFADDDGLVRIDHAGGGRTVLVNEAVARFVLDTGHVYFSTARGGNIFHVDKAGTNQPSMIVSDAIIGGFAVDEASVYYTCENGLVRRAKKGLRVVDGNVPVNLAKARDNGTDVALGEKADLFWIAGNAIFSAEK
ncbi:MAG: DUF5050 domain-containing protein [Labilithrix sp.]